MTRLLLALAATAVTTGAASAQFQQPYYNQPNSYGQQNYGQGYNQGYNQQFSQPNGPVSPYLNMLSNNNPAARYYNFTRPGTIGNTGSGTGAPGTAFGGNRQPFFPQLSNAPDPLQPAEIGVGSVLPPAGHPVVFNNTLGFYPSPFGGRGSGRNGLSGFGTSGGQRR